jgi:hypothetical protein
LSEFGVADNEMTLPETATFTVVALAEAWEILPEIAPGEAVEAMRAYTVVGPQFPVLAIVRVAAKVTLSNETSTPVGAVIVVEPVVDTPETV